MEEGQKHIDDFFREELGNYTEMPPEKVWEDLSQRLDDSRRPRFWGWWPWIVMLLLIGSVAGYMVLSKKNGPEKPVVAVVDNGLSVSSSGFGTESARPKAEHEKPKTEAEMPKAEAPSHSGKTAQNNSDEPKVSTEKPAANKLSRRNAADEQKKEGKKTQTAPTQGSPHDEVPAQETNADDASISNTSATTNTNEAKQPDSKPKTGNKETPNSTVAPATNKHANKSDVRTTAEDQRSSQKNVATTSTATPKAGGKKQIAQSPNASSRTTVATAAAANTTDTQPKTASASAASNNKTNQKQTQKNTAIASPDKQNTVNQNQSKTATAKAMPNGVRTASALSANANESNTPVQPKAATSTATKKQTQKNTASSPDKQNTINQNQSKTATAQATPNGTTKKSTTTKNTAQAATSAANNTTANNKTTKTSPATVDNKKPTTVTPAAETAKKPLPQPKQENTVAKTASFQPSPNPANGILIKPAEDGKKVATAEKDEEDEEKPAMNEDDEDNEAKPQQPKPTAEHDPRAGIPVSGYIDKAVPPQPKMVDDEDDSVDKKKIDLANPAGGAGGSMSPTVGKDRTSISRLEGGAKFGFEKGFSSVTSNKWVATIYLQYNLSPKAAFLVQPSVKFAQMNRAINSSQSFYNVTGTTVNSTQRMDSISTPPFFDTVYNYYYKQTYDSIHVAQSSTKNYVEFEIPVIFKYTIAKNLSLLAGITMNFGSIPTVSSSQTTYSGLTLQDSVVNVHNNPNYPISVNDSFHHTAQPYSSYSANDQNPSTNPIRFGYLLGMNYLLKDRVLFDLTVQQSFSNMNNVPNADIRKVLTQPYVRFSVGYKIFQGKKKAVQQ